MDKEREAFEDWIKNEDPFVGNDDNQDCIWAKKYMWQAWQAAKDEPHKQAALYQFEINHLAQANQQWREKAAKAQSVPDGFTLVSQKELLELTVAINAVDLATHTESKTNEVREMWQQVAIKLMALGKSQEPK